MVEICMVQKRKDHFYEGWLYHFLVDPLLRRVRRLVRSQVKPGSTLIDIGCGTGELLFSLADVGAKLVGVETSKRMWSFANGQARRRGYNNVQILLGDGAKLQSFSAGFFDYALACMVLHEMDVGQRLPVLKEMRRLAPQVIVVDYRVPPPANLATATCRFIGVGSLSVWLVHVTLIIMPASSTVADCCLSVKLWVLPYNGRSLSMTIACTWC